MWEQKKGEAVNLKSTKGKRPLTEEKSFLKERLLRLIVPVLKQNKPQLGANDVLLYIMGREIHTVYINIYIGREINREKQRERKKLTERDRKREK